MQIVFSEKCLDYWAPQHPESPDRVYLVHRLLKQKSFGFQTPEPCAEDDLRLVHSKEYIDEVRKGTLVDRDTPCLPQIYDYANLSAGAAIESMRIALEGEKAFSLMRPPGHHAGVAGRALGAISLGFCYFNNVAIACRKALGHVDRVAIVDVDGHHGNGTQEIFLGDPRVLFISLHRYGFIYPGTGGRSEENCLNYPFRHAVGDEQYLKTLEEALSKVERFDPDLVGVSAGFDTHRHDPYAGLGLSEDAYGEIGRVISRLDRRTFAVLEGGYGRYLPECIHNFLVGLEQA
jgi:acetoin utilization deacetylase AcuC-like enzyme